MIIKLLVEAGNMKPTPAISQKFGPLGINMGKVIAEVNKSTNQYAGLKVPVELDINPITKEFKVNVLTPPVSELLKKELGISKASIMPKSVYAGNLAIEQIINIAKKKQEDIGAPNLKKATKIILGTCVSSGFLVESKNPKEVIKEVEDGVYDDLITRAEKEELKVNKEKAEKLKADFAKVEASQEKLVKELKKAKEATAASSTSSASSTSASETKEKSKEKK